MTADRKTIVAKMLGCLVLVKARVCDVGTTGKCPVCGSTTFREAPYGWTECAECMDFAVNTESYKRLIALPRTVSDSRGHRP
jgi:hypothetical protein